MCIMLLSKSNNIDFQEIHILHIPYSRLFTQNITSAILYERGSSSLLVKISLFRSVPIPSYALPRKRRTKETMFRDWTGSTLLFSTTVRFCDIKQRQNCSFLTSSSIAIKSLTIRSSGVLLETGRVFLMSSNCGSKPIWKFLAKLPIYYIRCS